MCASFNVFARNPHILAGSTLESKECVPLQRMAYRRASLGQTVFASFGLEGNYFHFQLIDDLHDAEHR